LIPTAADPHDATRSTTASLMAVVVAVMLVTGFWWQGEEFIAANGPTFDEAPHLVAGYGYWATGHFRMNMEDPPVLKLWWALPLVLGDGPPYPRDLATTTNHDHWQVGITFLYGSGVSPTELLTPARRMNLVLGCGIVLVVGWWSFRVWGSQIAGLAAAAFAVVDPNLLALSCVLSTDVGFTLFAILSSYFLWEYAAAPSRWLLLATGASLGLMLGSKLSALGMMAGMAVAGMAVILQGGVLALPGTPERAASGTIRNRLRTGGDLAFRLGIIAFVTLAATYGFVHFDQWGRGLKFQLTRTDHGDGAFYLCGNISRTGWYHYFLVALALKIPLGLIAAVVGSAVWSFGRTTTSRPNPSQRERCSRAGGFLTYSGAWLIVPPLVFLAAISYSRVDLGLRVALPAIPFLYALAARLAGPGCGRVLRVAFLGGCVAWAGVSGRGAAPHQIAYVNELADGPVNALRFLADSNLDWGQGLPALKDYMAREEIEAVYLSYFGTDRPESHGIRFQPLPGYGRIGLPGGETIPPCAPRHVLAVSANNLLGIYLNDPNTFAWLRERSPTAVLAGCIYVFDLTADPVAVRRVRSLPLH
jgi:hypothetical protein